MFRFNSLIARIWASLVIILALFTIVIFVNRALSLETNNNTLYLTQSELIIRNAANLQRSIIDMGYGYRGYLLTGDSSFLLPYTNGLKQVPEVGQTLHKLLADTGKQQRRLDSILSRQEDWATKFAMPTLAQRTPGSAIQHDTAFLDALDQDRIVGLGQGKKLVDEIRALFFEFNDLEYAERAKRREALSHAIARSSNISIILVIMAIALGVIIISSVTRSISKRINQMVMLSENIAHGNFNTYVEDRDQDELSRLSASLNVMASKLDESFADLEKKNKELDQFAYIVSHDLKAPLRGIENVLHWLEEDAADAINETVRHYLDIILGRVKRLEGLINGILAFSRVEKVNLKPEVVDVRELVSDVVDLLSPPEGFTVRIGKMPVLETEKVYLQQVFSNLIDNAIKYHDRPDGTVEISCVDMPAHHQFTVRDDGPGIEPEYHQRIFVIFQTLAERDAVESTGVGLAIVKKIIDAKGGRVWVESEPGKGSAFIFTWPKASPRAFEQTQPSIV